MFAVIFIPDFSLQAVLRSEPELHGAPVALVNEAGGKGTISQFTQSARIAGVVEGMTPTQATARSPGIIIKNRSFAQEKTAGDVLLHSACQFSPSIEATAPGVCTLDLKGLRHLIDEKFGGEIIDLLARFHLRAKVGIAENPGLALQAARLAEPFLRVNDRIQFLAKAPLENIEPPSEIANVLRKWGIQTVGDFIALGRDRIAERLGVDGLEWFDRASANSARPLRLSHPPEIYEEVIEFEHEVESTEPLLFILRRFLDQICRRLELVYLVVEEIGLRLDLASGDSYERCFRIPSPTGNLDTLFRVLHTHLENLTMAHPITALRLNAKPCKPRHHQFGLFETSLRDPNHFYETLARLTALLGPDRVGTPVAESTHRPDAFRMETVRFDNSTARSEAERGLPPAGLTLRRLRPPLPVNVELRNNRPALLDSGGLESVVKPMFQAEWNFGSKPPSSRSQTTATAFARHIGLGVRGNTRIENAQGPWRSSGNWWDDQPWQRDEWDVQARDGTLYRLSHQSNGWFVEGVYD
ncbi:MAG: DNA polymerase Y family protein [Verrucomicrobia bacterium]|nr:DNA polymerase Y family protein [Verrucomicrobiota bacterium]